jgi:hypothetical protein
MVLTGASQVFKRSFVAAAAIGSIVASGACAQEARATDPHLYPFLGCWSGDSTAGSRGSLTCVVPVAGSPDVEMLGILDGRVGTRRRIEANTRPHPVDGQGCRGQERTQWSAEQRRVYLRSEYVCASTGLAGGTATLFSVLPNGDWLEVESVHTGAGTIVRAVRRRDAGVPADVPREIASQIGALRLAVMTARAEAASPLRDADVVEAMRATDTAVVREWLVATAQPFRLTGDQVKELIAANVPASVLQAMMSAPPAYQLGRTADAQGRTSDDYLNTPAYVPSNCCVAQVYENVYYSVLAEPSYVYPSMYGSVPYYSPYTYYSPYAHAPRIYTHRPVLPIHRSVVPPSSVAGPVGVRAGAPAPRPSAPPPGTTGRRR